MILLYRTTTQTLLAGPILNSWRATHCYCCGGRSQLSSGDSRGSVLVLRNVCGGGGAFGTLLREGHWDVDSSCDGGSGSNAVVMVVAGWCTGGDNTLGWVGKFRSDSRTFAKALPIGVVLLCPKSRNNCCCCCK